MKIENFKKQTISILLIIFFSIPALLPLFHNGLFVTDDGEWMIIRFSAFHQAFRDGQFPVRFLGRLNQEYGYPVANFMYPGFMYLGEFMHLLRFGFVDTVKIIFGLSLIASSVFTYLWLSRIFNKIPAIFGSLFFLYNPYHLFDIYRRGSLGEILALGITPFILWSIESGRPLFLAIGIGLLIISHNTLALLFLPLIILYTCLTNFKYIKFTVLGIGLAAFFWLPAVYDLQFTVFSQTKISNWENYFSDSSLIGIANIIVFIIACLLTLKSTLKKSNIFVIARKNDEAIPSVFALSGKIKFFLIITAIFVFLTLPLSAPVWKFLPVSFIQFPFRLLSISVIGFSFLTAYLLGLYKTKIQLALGLLLVSILLFYSLQYILNNEYFNKGEEYYSTNMATTTIHDEYMPIWVKNKPLQRAEKKAEIIKGQGYIRGISYNNKKISFTTDIKKEALIQINTIYWPGWIAFIDGKNAGISYNNSEGLIQLNIPKGDHKVEITFYEKPLSLFSDFVSVLSLLLIILIALIQNSKVRRYLKH